MPTFILLTRRAAASHVSSRMPAEGINLDDTRRRAGIGWWLSDSVTTGGWDHVNIFEAPNTAAALLIANRIESASGARTELWPVGEGVVNCAAQQRSPKRREPQLFRKVFRSLRDAITGSLAKYARA